MEILCCTTRKKGLGCSRATPSSAHRSSNMEPVSVLSSVDFLRFNKKRSVGEEWHRDSLASIASAAGIPTNIIPDYCFGYNGNSDFLIFSESDQYYSRLLFWNEFFCIQREFVFNFKKETTESMDQTAAKRCEGMSQQIKRVLCFLTFYKWNRPRTHQDPTSQPKDG